jgi:2-oxoisovalerate dehydrogenase E2 component (dihydrolipoyl transacylase)
MKLPDVGEGVAEAELVEWFVSVGDSVTPDSPIAEVLTDKATVEISAPVSGTVTALHGEPGDVLAVGSDLVEIETADGAARAAPTTEDAPTETEPAERVARPAPPLPPPQPQSSLRSDRKATAAPAVRERARELGIDLAAVEGTGPDGRVVHADLDRFAPSGAPATATRGRRSGEGTSHPVRGVRRRIAERLTAAWTEIPHITYVEAVDVTELERLRAELNTRSDEHGGMRLSVLPFLATAIARAVVEQPGVNAHYDHASETLTTFDAVHVGIATQTDDGLRVPVVRHVESLGIRALAAEIARVSEAARTGDATRDELTGSTISITSLGALGGLVTTPLLNPPEVAIVGVNKIEIRPVWQDGTFVPRRMMNLSSSFDHRMVDGWDAAVFVQRLKTLLETPALLFLE